MDFSIFKWKLIIYSAKVCASAFIALILAYIIIFGFKYVDIFGFSYEHIPTASLYEDMYNINIDNEVLTSLNDDPIFIIKNINKSNQNNYIGINISDFAFTHNDASWGMIFPITKEKPHGDINNHAVFLLQNGENFIKLPTADYHSLRIDITNQPNISLKIDSVFLSNHYPLPYSFYVYFSIFFIMSCCLIFNVPRKKILYLFDTCVCKYNNDIIDKTAFIVFSVIFCISFLIRYFWIRDYTVLLVIDESIYISAARSFFNSAQFLYQGQPSTLTEALYSLLIAPIFMFYDPENILMYIRVYNLFIFSLGFVPIFLLAKKVLESNLNALLVVIIVIFLPDVFYAGLFGQEVIHFPLMMLFYLYFYKTVIENNIRNYIILGVILALLSVSKALGIAIFISYVIYILLDLCFFKRHVSKRQYFFNISLVIIFYVIVLLCFKFFIHYIQMRSSYDVSQAYSMMDYRVYRFLTPENLYNYIYTAFLGGLFYLFYSLIAVQVYPLLLSFLGFYNYSDNNKKLFFISFISLIVSICVISCLIYYIEDGSNEVKRVHTRYVFYMLVPFIIMMVRLFGEKIKIRLLLMIPGIFFILYYAINFNSFKIFFNARSDSTTLLYFKDTFIYSPLKVVYILIIIAILIYIGIKKQIIINKFLAMGLVLLFVFVSIVRNDRYLQFISGDFVSEKDYIAIAEQINKFHDEGVLIVSTFALTNWLDFEMQRMDAYLEHDNKYIDLLDLANYADNSGNGKVRFDAIIPGGVFYGQKVNSIGDMMYIVGLNTQIYGLKNTKKVEDTNSSFSTYKINNNEISLDYILKFKDRYADRAVNGDIIYFYGNKSLSNNSAKLRLKLTCDSTSCENIVFKDTLDNEFYISFGQQPVELEITASKKPEENRFELLVNMPKDSSFQIIGIDPL